MTDRSRFRTDSVDPPESTDGQRAHDGGPVHLKTSTSGVDLAGVVKRYGSVEVLHGVDLRIPAGGLTAILGASGSGKTTLLNIIAGFERVEAGTVRIADAVVDGPRGTVRPQRRGVGYVPQDAALFPHLTASSNVAFGVRRRDRQTVGDLLDLVGLSGYGHRYPHQLSGGQQQRVALARALAITPRVVLLDEPFGSLDAGLRETVRADVARILAETGTTTILVTHDQDEALSIADTVALLEAGRIVASGSPTDLYEKPPSAAVASAIGIANLLPGRADGGTVSYALGTFRPDRAERQPNGAGLVFLRPERVRMHGSPQAGSTTAVVQRIRYHGHDALIDLEVADHPGQLVTARVDGRPDLVPGQPTWVSAIAPTWLPTTAKRPETG